MLPPAPVKILVTGFTNVVTQPNRCRLQLKICDTVEKKKKWF